MARKKRAHVFVSGRVQGVYFRDSARAEALNRGIAGWVKNLPDGRVEAIFEGDESGVDELVKWCHAGPPEAFVTSVEVQEEPYSGEQATFVVKRGYYY